MLNVSSNGCLMCVTVFFCVRDPMKLLKTKSLIETNITCTCECSRLLLSQRGLSGATGGIEDTTACNRRRLSLGKLSIILAPQSDIYHGSCAHAVCLHLCIIYVTYKHALAPTPTLPTTYILNDTFLVMCNN